MWFSAQSGKCCIVFGYMLPRFILFFYKIMYIYLVLMACRRLANVSMFQSLVSAPLASQSHPDFKAEVVASGQGDSMTRGRMGMDLRVVRALNL